MKKHFLILLFVFSTNFIFSQEGFKGGIFIGAVASQVDGDMLIGYNKAGAQAGIFLVNKLDKNFGFSMEMKYIQKGSRTNSPAPDSINVAPPRYYKLRLSYIEVPFLLNFYLKKRFMIETGLGFGYLFRIREDIGGFGMGPTNPYEKQFKRFEIPLIFGVAYYPTENIHLDFRASYSAFAIRSHPGNQTWYFNRGQYNNLISFGIYFNI